MMEFLQNFHFLRPYWLIALLLPLFFGRHFLKRENIKSSWAAVCDPHLLNFLLIKGKNRQRRTPYVLALLIVIIGIICLSGPSWVKKKNPALSVDNPVMIMINLSSNMWAKDVSPSRIYRTLYTSRDLLKAFASTETGLLVYTREPFVITPLTEDTAVIENLLPELTHNIMPENGDRLDRALDLAVERMKDAGYSKGNLVVLTADVGERFDAALESAMTAADDGFSVNIIKVSAEKNDKLQMVADKGRGIYLNYDQSMAPLISKINDVYAKELKQSENMQTTWEDMGYFMFWIPAFLLLYFFRKGVIIGLILCAWTTSAEAGWFLNDNQEAMKQFEAGNYSAAGEKFTHVGWRGAAEYKNKDYAAALRDFSESDDAEALYNQGNALAKMGKIEEAIAKYEEVLRKQEDFSDAKFNLEYLKKLQQQQQNQQQQNQKQDKQQNQQQQQQNQRQDSAANNQENSADEQQSSADKQNQEQAQPQDQQEQQQQSAEDQAESGEKGDKSEQNSEQNSGTDKEGQSGEDKAQNDNSNSADNQGNDDRSDNSDDNGEVEQTAAYGNENKQSEQEAESRQFQAGDKKSENNEKIRARMQKYREIPEDAGGLLRAIIAKEYGRNRYRDR